MSSSRDRCVPVASVGCRSDTTTGQYCQMDRINTGDAVLRAGILGSVFLAVAIWAAFVSHASAVPVVVGVVIGLGLLVIGIRSGQVVPGGRTTDRRAVGTGATIGVVIATFASSASVLIDAEAAKLIVAELRVCKRGPHWPPPSGALAARRGPPPRGTRLWRCKRKDAIRAGSAQIGSSSGPALASRHDRRVGLKAERVLARARRGADRR
jgi:hypothetical protein